MGKKSLTEETVATKKKRLLNKRVRVFVCVCVLKRHCFTCGHFYSNEHKILMGINCSRLAGHYKIK